MANLWLSYSAGILSLNAFIAASGIGAGATIQTLLATWLVKRFVGFPNLLNDAKSILLFAFLAGPLSCLVSATCANLALYFTGAALGAGWLVSWATWWVGDTIGVLVFAPLLLVLFAKPREVWRRRVIPIVVPLCFLFICVVIFFGLARQAESHRLQLKFELQSFNLVRGIEEKFNDVYTVLGSLRAYYDSSEHVTQTEFKQYTQQLLMPHASIQAVMWVPRVSEKGQDHYPIRYIEPLAKNKSDLDFDLGTNKVLHEALQKSLVSNSLVATAPINLLKNPSQPGYVFLFLPVYKGQPLMGYVSGMLDVKRMVDDAIVGLDHSFIQIKLVDKTADSPIFLFKTDVKGNLSTSLSAQNVFNFGGRQWLIQFTPTRNYAEQYYSWQVWGVLAGGLLFVGLVSLFLLILSGQHNVVQQEVEQRTRELKVSEVQKRLLLESAGEGIIGIGQEGIVAFANPSAAKMLGYSVDDLVGKKIDTLIEPGSDRGLLKKAYQEGAMQHAEQAVFLRHDGSKFPVEYTNMPIRQEDNLSGAVITFSDVTERMQAEQQLQYLAKYDQLTGLPNRTYFEERLAATLAAAKFTQEMFALMYMDLDNFKTVNDTLGHIEGDELLKQVAIRLREFSASYDFLGRLGGDEFVMMVRNIPSPEAAGDLAKKIVESFQQPFKIFSQTVNSSISIGIACFPIAGSDEARLIKNADIALYRSKSLGKAKYQFFNEQVNEVYVRSLTIQSGLAGVTGRDELFLNYQALFSLETNKVVGVEVLLRWQHPTLGLLSPGEFIPLAEENREIIAIGSWVLNKACEQFSQWREKYPFFYMAVNVSPVQVLKKDFTLQLEEILQQYRISPGELELELTESLLMAHWQQARDTLSQVNALGVRLAIDDFGTGFSSLSRIKDFPLQTLKIDASFVSDITKDVNDAMIVKSIIGLAENLNLSVVAEGIETTEQLDFLRANGCKIGQGYHFSRPVSAKEFEKLLQAN